MVLEKEYALIGATLIDGNGGTPVKDTIVVVKDGVIEKIEDMRSMTIKTRIQEVGVSGCYIMPGLIDLHVHLNGIKTSWDVGGVIENKYLKCIRSVADTWKILDHGITTVRDMSWNGLYLKKAIEEGSIVGPRIIAYGPPLSRTGGHGDLRRDIYDLSSEYVKQNSVTQMLCDGVSEVRKAVRELISRGADGIKLYASGGLLWEKDRAQDIHYSMEELKAIVDETHMMVGFKVAAHAESMKAVKMCLEAGVDTIEHGEELDEEACKEMALRNVILIPTIASCFVGHYAFTQDQVKSLYRNFRMARDLGVKMGMGSDAITETLTPFGQYNVTEIKRLVDAGLSNMEAIVAATKIGAEVCGIDDKVGVIEEGKIADLLVVKEDPTTNIDILLNKENIKFVIKEGNLVVEH